MRFALRVCLATPIVCALLRATSAQCPAPSVAAVRRHTPVTDYTDE